MIRLRFADSPKDALKRCRHLVVAAPASTLQRRPWKAWSRASWTSLLPRLVEDLEPGVLGRTATTYTGTASPRRITLAALPDTVSRHLSPSRSHAVRHCCANARVEAPGETTVVLVVEDDAHLLPTVAAVARVLPTYDRRTRERAPSVVTLAASRLDGTPLRIPRDARSTAEALRWAADLVDRPAAELSTEGFVDQALLGLKPVSRRMSWRVLTGDELAAEGLGGLRAVGHGAAVPPRLLVLEHAPAKARGSVALVGKGIVYDTGGLSLKPRDFMRGMKADMGGAAAVVGAFRVLARHGCGRRVLAVIPLAENAIGPNSYRPDDIVTLHCGTTVEINNPDAEGRILLADGLSYARRVLEADVVIDAATLTGAQGVATGKHHAAVATNDARLETVAVAAGLATGDTCQPVVWAPELHEAEFESEVADVVNSVKDRGNAQVSCAAWFVHLGLRGTDTPWLHVDLASPAHVDHRATGFGVALLAEVARSLPDELFPA